MEDYRPFPSSLDQFCISSAKIQQQKQRFFLFISMFQTSSSDSLSTGSNIFYCLGNRAYLDKTFQNYSTPISSNKHPSLIDLNFSINHLKVMTPLSLAPTTTMQTSFPAKTTAPHLRHYSRTQRIPRHQGWSARWIRGKPLGTWEHCSQPDHEEYPFNRAPLQHRRRKEDRKTGPENVLFKTRRSVAAHLQSLRITPTWKKTSETQKKLKLSCFRFKKTESVRCPTCI